LIPLYLTVMAEYPKQIQPRCIAIRQLNLQPFLKTSQPIPTMEMMQ
jgi:hypothetical protein